MLFRYGSSSLSLPRSKQRHDALPQIGPLLILYKGGENGVRARINALFKMAKKDNAMRTCALQNANGDCRDAHKIAQRPIPPW